MQKTISLYSVNSFSFRELRRFRAFQFSFDYNTKTGNSVISKPNTNRNQQTLTYSFYGNAEAISPAQRRRLRADTALVVNQINQAVAKSVARADNPKLVK